VTESVSRIAVPMMNVVRENQILESQLSSAISGVFRHGQFMLGPEVATFEERVARFLGVSHVIGVNSGTDALLFALKAVGAGPGDEIVTAANSFIATAGAARQLGIVVRFADVGPDENLDPLRIEEALTPRTKAIVPVHLRGRPARLDEICEIAARHGIPVIEDASQAFGARIGDRHVGTIGALGCFSMHPQKVLAAIGDAGIVTTNDAEAARQIRLWRHHGLRSRDEASVWGQNSRLDSLQAAVLLVKLDYVSRWIERRREIARIYDAAFSDIARDRDLVLPEEAADQYSVYYHYSVFSERRDEFQAALHEHGVDARAHYPIPIHKQDAALPSTMRLPIGGLPVTEWQAARQLSLPIHHDFSDDQIACVIAAVNSFYGRARNTPVRSS